MTAAENKVMREDMREQLFALEKKVDFVADCIGDMTRDFQQGEFTIELEQIRYHLNCALAAFELVTFNYEALEIRLRESTEDW